MDYELEIRTKTTGSYSGQKDGERVLLLQVPEAVLHTLIATVSKLVAPGPDGAAQP